MQAAPVLAVHRLEGGLVAGKTSLILLGSYKVLLARRYCGPPLEAPCSSWEAAGLEWPGLHFSGDGAPHSQSGPTLEEWEISRVRVRMLPYSDVSSSPEHFILFFLINRVKQILKYSFINFNGCIDSCSHHRNQEAELFHPPTSPLHYPCGVTPSSSPAPWYLFDLFSALWFCLSENVLELVS